MNHIDLRNMFPIWTCKHVLPRMDKFSSFGKVYQKVTSSTYKFSSHWPLRYICVQKTLTNLVRIMTDHSLKLN